MRYKQQLYLYGGVKSVAENVSNDAKLFTNEAVGLR